MKNIGLNATTLRIVMFTILALLITGSIGGFIYTYDWLSNLAAEINYAVQQSQTAPVTTLTPDQQVISDRIASMGIEASGFRTKIAKDLNTYASIAEVPISSISLTQQPSGLVVSPVDKMQPKFLKVVIKNPVRYDSFVKFLKAIETNLPVLRVTGVKITHNKDSGDTIEVDPLTIMVYTR